MSRKDKITGFILGTALFLGLSYFIYASMKDVPPEYAVFSADEPE